MEKVISSPDPNHVWVQFRRLGIKHSALANHFGVSVPRISQAFNNGAPTILSKLEKLARDIYLILSKHPEKQIPEIMRELSNIKTTKKREVANA